jgi:protein O-mannosyl-transferase
MLKADMRRDWVVVLLLAAITVISYWEVNQHQFVNYDDTDYVTQNPQVQAGVTRAGLAWAFDRLHGEQTYWHPLTWVSHMLDCQLFGLRPAGHHLVNLLFHTLNTVLVFLLFRRLTGAFWRCAVLAALFALHPLQVGTVAWVAERKNVLSAFFWVLTTWTYVRYAEVPRPKPKVQSPLPGADSGHDVSRFTLHPWRFYALSLLFFALGLMCKPVLVTLPFVLLLLDYWPLGRLSLPLWRFLPAPQNTAVPRGGDSSRVQQIGLGRGAPQYRTVPLVRLVVEKLPFFALAAASSLITLAAHRSLGGLSTQLPLGLRLANAVVSYARYLAKTIWPSHLAVFYPYPEGWPMWTVALCGLLLLAFSGLALSQVRRCPWLFVGWFWFLGALVPCIGLVQAGGQAMADRFLYVPVMGLFIVLVWGAHELTARWRYQGRTLSATAVLAIFFCLALTRREIGFWANSQTLFERALAVTKDNYVAHNNLGNVLDKSGQHAAAKQHYEETLRIRPDFAGTHYNLGNVLMREGNYDAALKHYRTAVALKPDYADALYNLGVLLANLGRTAEAIEQHHAALRYRPAFAEAQNNLGNLYFKQGRVAEAAECYRAALRTRPDYLDALLNLGLALKQPGKESEALEQYAEAVRLHPASPRAHSDLAIALARRRRLPEAERHFAEVVRLEPQNADAHYNLANVLLEQGKLDQAASQYAETLRLNPGDDKARRKLEKTTSDLDRARRQPPSESQVPGRPSEGEKKL